MRRVCALPIVAVLVMLAGCKSGTAGRVISVSVAPSGVNLVVGTTQQMTATVLQTFNTAVNWSVAGGSANGTISSTGLYTAPATVPAQVTVTATSQKDPTKSGSATLTITTAAGPSNITVAVSPAVVT